MERRNLEEKVEKKNIDEIIKENMARHEELMSMPLGILIDKLGYGIFELVEMIDMHDERMYELIIDVSRMHEVVVEKLQSKLGENVVERTSVNYVVDQTIKELEISNSLFGRELISVAVAISKLKDIKTFVGCMV